MTEENVDTQNNVDTQEQTQEEEGEMNLLDQTREVVALQKAENDRTEGLVLRMEKAKSINLLGGGSPAGKPTEDKKPEESPKEYRARVNKEMAEGKTEW